MPGFSYFATLYAAGLYFKRSLGLNLAGGSSRELCGEFSLELYSCSLIRKEECGVGSILLIVGMELSAYEIRC